MKYNKQVVPALLGLLVMFLGGCASAAYVEKDPSANFAAYKSFNWLSRDGKAKVSDLTDRLIRSSITVEMEKMGFRESKNRPDILLDYDVLVERSVQRQSQPVYSQPTFQPFFNPYTRRWGTMYFPSQFMGTQSYNVPVNEGTLTITLLDARSEKTVWQGWATNVVNGRNMSVKEIDRSVRSIVKKLESR